MSTKKKLFNMFLLGAALASWVAWISIFFALSGGASWHWWFPMILLIGVECFIMLTLEEELGANGGPVGQYKGRIVLGGPDSRW